MTRKTNYPIVIPDASWLNILNWLLLLLYHMLMCVCMLAHVIHTPGSKVHGANMGPIWDRQGTGGPHIGPMNFVIWSRVTNSCSLHWFPGILVCGPSFNILNWSNCHGYILYVITASIMIFYFRVSSSVASCPCIYCVANWPLNCTVVYLFYLCNYSVFYIAVF